MLKLNYFLADIFILSAEKQPIKLSWRKIEWLLEKVIRFKTMIEYCYLYPDKIIMTSNGNPEKVNSRKRNKRYENTWFSIP